MRPVAYGQTVIVSDVGSVRMKVLYLALVAVLAIIVAMLAIHADVQKSEDGGYLYAVYTDSESNMDVVDVYESHVENGRATVLSQRYRISDSAGGINPLWEFDAKTGKGPFGSFYAAVNLLADGPAYNPDDSAEKRMSSAVGAVAYILDPSDLSRTLAGHVFSPGLYNVMLVIPTVYWLSEKTVAERSVGNLVGGVEYNVLYLSSSPSYAPSGHAKVSGMMPYAHSASLESGRADFVTHVYPYLGIGVYEGYATVEGDVAGPGKLVSQSGRVPTAGPDVDGFKSLADALNPMSDNGPRPCYQQWNYYQWTLYKMMCYAVMGSKNSQVMVGDGYTKGNDSPAVTGSTDSLGFYGIADSTKSASGQTSSEEGRTSSKLFIENGWGSLNVFVGDAYVMGDSSSSQYLYAGNYLGGETLITGRAQPSAGQIWADIFVSGEAHRVISGASVNSATWDSPTAADADRSAYTDPGRPGDIVNAVKSGVSSITAGGRWDNSHYAGVSFVCAGYDIALANQYRGARLAYLMSEDVLRTRRVGKGGPGGPGEVSELLSYLGGGLEDVGVLGGVVGDVAGDDGDLSDGLELEVVDEPALDLVGELLGSRASGGGDDRDLLSLVDEQVEGGVEEREHPVLEDPVLGAGLSEVYGGGDDDSLGGFDGLQELAHVVLLDAVSALLASEAGFASVLVLHLAEVEELDVLPVGLGGVRDGVDDGVAVRALAGAG